MTVKELEFKMREVEERCGSLERLLEQATNDLKQHIHKFTVVGTIMEQETEEAVIEEGN